MTEDRPPTPRRDAARPQGAADDALTVARRALLDELERVMLAFDRSTDSDHGRGGLVEVFTDAALAYGAISQGAILIDETVQDWDGALATYDGSRSLVVRHGPSLLPNAHNLAEAVYRDAARKLAEAEEQGDLPRGFSAVVPVVARRWTSGQLEAPPEVVTAVTERLRRSEWQYVFHVTRADRLASVARLGVVDGGIVDLLGEDPDGRKDRRDHGDQTRQDRLYDRTFFGFWPPWWLFTPAHYGTHDAVLLAIDAAAVCTQADVMFVPRSVRHRSVTGEYLERCSTSAADPLAGWRSCWPGRRPMIEAEIIANRVHPRHIGHVIFANEQVRDRWWPSFLASYQAAYPSADASEAPTARLREISQAGALMRLPDSYR